MGRGQEGIAQAKQAVELDPLQPWRYGQLAYAFYMDHEYDQALKADQKFREMTHSGGGWYDAVIRVETGMYKEAIADFQKIRGPGGRLGPGVLGHLGNAYARAGMKAEARNCLRELKEDLKKNNSVGMYEVALIYAGLGEKDQAIQWLNKAYERRDKGLTFMQEDPPLAPLRSDPRFQALVRRMNFPQ